MDTDQFLGSCSGAHASLLFDGRQLGWRLAGLLQHGKVAVLLEVYPAVGAEQDVLLPRVVPTLRSCNKRRSDWVIGQMPR